MSLRNAANVAATVPQIEQDAANLRAALSERDAMLEVANSTARLAEEERSASVAEREALKARITSIERDRDDLAAALEAARAEMTSGKSALAEHQAVSAEALRRADNLAEELYSMQLTLGRATSGKGQLSE